jgi:hypothetical protein
VFPVRPSETKLGQELRDIHLLSPLYTPVKETVQVFTRDPQWKQQGGVVNSRKWWSTIYNPIPSSLMICCYNNLQRLQLGTSEQRNDHNYCLWEQTQRKKRDTFSD